MTTKQFDTIENEHVKISRKQFAELLSQFVSEYNEAFKDNPNEFQAQEHTFDQWLASFANWMSF